MYKREVGGSLQEGKMADNPILKTVLNLAREWNGRMKKAGGTKDGEIISIRLMKGGWVGGRRRMDELGRQASADYLFEPPNKTFVQITFAIYFQSVRAEESTLCILIFLWFSKLVI